MHHRFAWTSLALAFSAAPWLLLHAGCGKGEVEDVQPPTDAGAGDAEAGTFDVIVDVPSSPNCDDPTDSDGDNVADVLEGAPTLDTDGDTVPDYLDDDSDGDGVSDAIEAANAFLPGSQAGKVRGDPCAPLADSDGDSIPDLRDVDSDGDGVADEDEADYDPDGSLGCRVKPDCDGDDVVDPVELASGSDVLDKDSIPPDATLYFVLPYEAPTKTKDFEFSAGVKKADVYFLIDTTESMQAAIDNVSSSLDSTILPAILNGDSSASPPIPAIPGAWVGVGAFRDVPWAPWGATTDELYEARFEVGGSEVSGNLAEPALGAGGLVAPDSVRKILGALQAAGGGDAPEGLSQALWIAASGGQYAATLGGLWTAPTPSCVAPGELGLPCFRPDALPVFVLITDAPMHNGPVAGYDYSPATTGGTKSYTAAVDALNSLGAKVVGVSVNTGTPGVARADMRDLAEKTGSLWHDPAFGGNDYPLVTDQDTATGDVSNEVVRLIGLLAGQGLNNVTTLTRSYFCAGGVDCDGDGVADPSYENPVIAPETEPFDAARLIVKVEPVASSAVPLPYAEMDATTFYGVRGDATVSFRVHARNSLLQPSSMKVLRALIRVQTPKGQQLGGASGVKVVYLVIPRYVQQTY